MEVIFLHSVELSTVRGVLGLDESCWDGSRVGYSFSMIMMTLISVEMPREPCGVAFGE